MIGKKKPYIEIQTQATLTNNGVGFFMEKKHKLTKVTTIEGLEQYGVKLAKILPSSFQYMLRTGYFSRLEISRTEFTTVRSEIMDLSKLIVFGFLYTKFDQVIFDMLIGSSMIKEWNRANPVKIIDGKTKINDSFLNDVLAKNTDHIKTIRKGIIQPLQGKIAKDKSLKADEKNIMIFLTDRFLDHLRPLIWFVLIKFESFDEHKKIIETFREHLDLYIRRSRIADFITLLLMELSISAETLNMTSFAERIYAPGTDVQNLIYNSTKREALLKAMIEARSDFTVAWKIDGNNSTSIGNKKKLELTIYNRAAEFAELKEKVEEKMQKGSDVSLEQFYQNSSTGNEEMGLLYLAYLQEECNKVGMRFTSRVGEARGGVPSITLTLIF